MWLNFTLYSRNKNVLCREMSLLKARQTNILIEGMILSDLISFIKTSYLHRNKVPLPLLNCCLSFLKICLDIILILTLELMALDVFYQSAKIIGIH